MADLHRVRTPSTGSFGTGFGKGSLRVGTACLGLLLAVALGGAALAAAQTSEKELELARRARALSGEVMSPFCPGRTLADCPSPNATAERERIRRYLESGLSPEEIKAEFRRNYGDIVVAVPRGQVGWMLPAVILMIGAIVLFAVLRTLQRGSARKDASPGGVDPRLEAELDAELRSRGFGSETNSTDPASASR